MFAVALRRIDQPRNMARFYAVDVLPTLFGHWAVVRRWGASTPTADAPRPGLRSSPPQWTAQGGTPPPSGSENMRKREGKNDRLVPANNQREL